MKTNRVLLLFVPLLLVSCPSSKTPWTISIPSIHKVDSSYNKLGFELMLKDLREGGLYFATLHSWQLWREINKPAFVGPAGSNGQVRLPTWLTWCNQLRALNLSEDQLHRCSPDSKSTEFLLSDFFEELAFRTKFSQEEAQALFQHPKPQSTGFPTPLLPKETIHYSPQLVKGLRTFMKKELRCEKSGISSFSLCIKEKAGEWTPELSQKLSEAIPKEAIIVKASWLIFDVGSKKNDFNVPVWNGLPSGVYSAIGTESPAPPFTLKSAGIPISIPAEKKNGACTPFLPFNPVKNGKWTAGSFFNLRNCDNLKEKLKGPNFTGVLSPNTIAVLVGLHVITNQHPDGSWTWSTFSWHPDASAETGLSAREKTINSYRPLDLAAWESHFRLNFQFEEEKSPTLQVAMDQYANSKCQTDAAGQQVDPPHHVMFNPYIEAMKPCGEYSNCLGCHSRARISKEKLNPLPENPENRNILKARISRPNEDFFTHFIWSFAF